MLLALYAVSYLVLTLSGEYIIANHGGADWTREWCPQFVVQRDERELLARPRVEITRLGWCYLPLLAADRLLWHKTFRDDRVWEGIEEPY
jgi:hypothetical protein